MKPGILLITHPGIGSGLLHTASAIMGGHSLNASVLEVPMNEDIDVSRARALDEIVKLDKGAGVLVLNDIYGATPYNVAQSVLNTDIRILSGVNLNMLLRAITYQELALEPLAEKAREGGINGVRLHLE